MHYGHVGLQLEGVLSCWLLSYTTV